MATPTPESSADAIAGDSCDDRSRVATRNHAESEVCAICLSQITQRAVATPCNHLSFDYLCLVQWIQMSARCPLCSAAIEEVQYNWRGPDEFRRYIVPKALIHATGPHPGSTTDPGDRSQAREAEEQRCQPLLHPSLAKRRHVYKHHLFSQHVGSSKNSGYTEYTTQTFSDSPELQSRARTFLRRELAVLDSMLHTEEHHPPRQRARTRGRQATADYLVEFIVAVLRTHEPRAFDGRAEALIADFLPLDITQLLLHELTAWLRSPFERLRDWDEVVQYYTVPA